MVRVRISTTVDADLITRARQLHVGPNDASLVDEALRELLATNRATEIDAANAAYDHQPDECG